MDILAIVPIVSAIAELLVSPTAPIEESLIIYHRRSGYIGSLSAVSAFLAAVQAQFLSFTYQKASTRLQIGANVCFLLGVGLNVIGATTSILVGGTVPDLASSREDLVAYQRAIMDAQEITDNPPADSELSERLRSWARNHLQHVTDMFTTGHLIMSWNFHSNMQILVMWTGVYVFFLGLVFFIIDTQPRVIWVTVLSIATSSYFLLVGLQGVLQMVYAARQAVYVTVLPGFTQQSWFRRFLYLSSQGLPERSRAFMANRQRVLLMVTYAYSRLERE